jgi:hypothetical protein
VTNVWVTPLDFFHISPEKRPKGCLLKKMPEIRIKQDKLLKD